MSKIEITDAMVERAAEALKGLRPVGEERNSARRILDAALNPPAEPGIVVTEVMLSAGFLAFNAWPGSPDMWTCLRDAYRAMRKLEPKIADPAIRRMVLYRGSRVVAHARLGDADNFYHRRSGDPR